MGMNLFDRINKVPEEQWHRKFRLLKEDADGADEREIISEWVEGMVDRDHNMIEKFQKSFHSSFWEFYLYACFREAGFMLDQTHNRPDFIITEPFEMLVEAVVANIKKGGRQETERNAIDLMDMFVPPRNQEDFYEIQHEAITRQANAVTSKIKKYSEYLKCNWVKSETPFVIAISSYGQVNYGREYIYPMMTLLYGMYYKSELDDYVKVQEIPKPESESKIPVGIFCTDQYKDISAILYSCTTTLGKVTSLSITKGNNSHNNVYNLRRDYEDVEIPFKIQKVSEDSQEFLTDGLFLFHNPFAKNKLDIRAFENTNVTQYFWQDSKLLHTANTYPIVCRLNIPKIWTPIYENLIDEYYRQYNRIKPLEYYSLEKTEMILPDFKRNCLVCIWVPITPDGVYLRNIHYERSQVFDDNFLKKEAFYEIEKIRQKKLEYLGPVVQIDIIRSQESFDIINQP